MKMVHHPCGAATVWPCTAGFVAVYLLFHSATVQLCATFDSTLNIIKLCIIVHHKIQFFCFASAQKMKNTYKYTHIYICIHSINKCLVKEQILLDTHTYGIS